MPSTSAGVFGQGWVELESDPSLFSKLVEDLGVENVEVEEIYDMEAAFEDVLGFIFLYKYPNDRRTSKAMMQAKSAGFEETDDCLTRSMFFAHQIVQGSCATHALLHVLLNCENIELGSILQNLKSLAANQPPDSKGYLIESISELAEIHNSHARPTPDAVMSHFNYAYDAFMKQKDSNLSTSGVPSSAVGSSTSTKLKSKSKKKNQVWDDQFHFTSYVPINQHLYELDGLRSLPRDHGEFGHDKKYKDWREIFRMLLKERMDVASSLSKTEDIRFNLMAVKPKTVTVLRSKIESIKCEILKLTIMFQEMEPDIEYLLDLQRIYSSMTEHPDLQSLISIVPLKQEEEILNIFDQMRKSQCCTKQEPVDDDVEDISLCILTDLVNAVCDDDDVIVFDLIVSILNKIETESFVNSEMHSVKAETSDVFEPEIGDVCTTTQTMNESLQIYEKLKSLALNLINGESRLRDEISKSRTIEIDDQRRSHDYSTFIRKYIDALYENRFVLGLEKLPRSRINQRKIAKRSHKKQKTSDI